MSGDPRLNTILVTPPTQDSQVIIVGCPFDFARKRAIKKGGQDNGPCCLRRFYKKVGPIINPEYGVDISTVKIADFGNIEIKGLLTQEQFEKKKHTEKFADESIKISLEKVLVQITTTIKDILSKKQLPFVFGGSKQAMLGTINAFKCTYPLNSEIIVISGKPNIKKLYDNDKLASDNVITKLLYDYPKQKLTLIGPHTKQIPSQHQLLHKTKQNIKFISYQDLRNYKYSDKEKKLGITTQFAFLFEQLLKSSEKFIHVSLSVEAIEQFKGCRDQITEGLNIQQILESFYIMGKMIGKVMCIDINEFNPSCQDFQSSLLILNLFYYFLMGRAQAINNQ